MKRNFNLKVLFGASAFSLISNFTSLGTSGNLEGEKVPKATCYKNMDILKPEISKNLKKVENKSILPKIKKIIKAVPKLIVSYSVSAIAGLFTIYITDKVSVKLLDVKPTDYLSNLFK